MFLYSIIMLFLQIRTLWHNVMKLMTGAVVQSELELELELSSV